MKHKMINKLTIVCATASLIASLWVPAFAVTEITPEPKGGDNVASSSEMAPPQEVGTQDMTPVSAADVANGTYDISVDSSSSMFKVVKCELSVTDTEMTATMTLSGQGYGKLFLGTAEEAAAAADSDCIPYVEDADGAYTYTVSVEALDKVIKCAAWSTKKEKWYDRDLVFRSDSLPEGTVSGQSGVGLESIDMENGTYQVEVTLSGGSGKASIKSPTTLTFKDGEMTARIEWSSPYYDYMLIGDKRYEPVNTDGNSVFEIPVPVLDEAFEVVADTTAMSTPHEITYTLSFDSSTLKHADDGTKDGGKEGYKEGELTIISQSNVWVIVGLVALFVVCLAAGVLIGRRIARKNAGKEKIDEHTENAENAENAGNAQNPDEK